MKAAISYKELSEYIRTHHGQNVAFTYVDETTITATVSVKVLLMPVSVSLGLHIDSAYRSEVTLIYSGKHGVDLVITGVLRFLEAKFSNAINFIKYDGGQSITLYLGRIEQLKSVFETISLDGIKFNNTGVDVHMKLL